MLDNDNNNNKKKKKNQLNVGEKKNGLELYKIAI